MRPPVLAIDSPPDVDPESPERNAVDSRSATYLVANPNGTFGVASESRMTVAPVSLLTDPATGLSAVTVEILGEWGSGGSTHRDSPQPPSTTGPTPPPRRRPRSYGCCRTVWRCGIDFHQLVGGEGVEVPGLPLLRIALGEDPRAIATPGTAPDSTSLPTRTLTEGSAAADVASIQRLRRAHLADPRRRHAPRAHGGPGRGGVRACLGTAGATTTTTIGAATTTASTGGTTTTSAVRGNGGYDLDCEPTCSGAATVTTAAGETIGPPTQVGGAQFRRPDVSSGTSGTRRARGERLPRMGAGASTSGLLGLGACVLTLGVAVVSVGRRLRRRARAS